MLQLKILSPLSRLRFPLNNESLHDVYCNTTTSDILFGNIFTKKLCANCTVVDRYYGTESRSESLLGKREDTE